jgi:hypothetical protein
VEDPHNSWVPESLIEVLKSCTRMLRSTSELVRNLNSFLDKRSQARRQSSTVLFIFVIHAVSNTLDKKWDFTTPDFRWFPDTQVGSKPRGQLRGTNHSNKCSRSSSPIMSTIRPSFFSAAESDRRHRLSLSTFWSDYSHWK